MDKTLIFNPDAIEEINYAPGHHTANPKGRVVYPEAREMKLLHYKYLGANYLHQRHQALQTRRRPLDLVLKYGFHYARTEAENLAELAETMALAVEVIKTTPSWLSGFGKAFFRTR